MYPCDPENIFGKRYLTTKFLMNQNIPFNRIREWECEGRIVKMDRGLYSLPGTETDVLALIQNRYDRCVFSGITALSIHGLTNHVSENCYVTFPKGYNPSSIRECVWDLSISRSIPRIFEAGIETKITKNGNAVRVYNKERTLCDSLRGNGLPPFILNSAMRMYLEGDGRDVDSLLMYADLLRVRNKAETFIRLYG